MTQRIALKRGALWLMPEVTPGTYVAPTVISDYALDPIEFEVSIVGGNEDQLDHLTPVLGGAKPLRGATAWKVTHSYKIPVAPSLTDDTSHPLFAVLRSVAATTSELTTPNRIRVTPSNVFNPGTTPVTLSITFAEIGGNCYTGTNGTSALVGIDADGAHLVMRFESEFNMRDTLTASVVDIATASIDPTAAIYISDTYVPSHGGTLTLTNVDGSAVWCVEEIAIEPGCALVSQPCRSATNGYASATSIWNGYAMFAIDVLATPELATSAGRQSWESYLSNETLGTCSIVFGSGAGAFTVAAPAGMIKVHDRGTSGDLLAYRLGVVTQATTGNAHITFTWGA